MVTRAAVGWALLFAVPPAVGVTGYASILMTGRLIEPAAIAVGAAAGVAIFGLVLGAQLTGSAEPEAVRERID